MIQFISGKTKIILYTLLILKHTCHMNTTHLSWFLTLNLKHYLNYAHTTMWTIPFVDTQSTWRTTSIVYHIPRELHLSWTTSFVNYNPDELQHMWTTWNNSVNYIIHRLLEQFHTWIYLNSLVNYLLRGLLEFISWTSFSFGLFAYNSFWTTWLNSWTRFHLNFLIEVRELCSTWTT